VICETKCIWSRYLLLNCEESLPNLVPWLRRGPGRFNRLMRLCSFVEQITLLREIGRQPLQEQRPAYRVFRQPDSVIEQGLLSIHALERTGTAFADRRLVWSAKLL
jgi:hypothetical protein